MTYRLLSFLLFAAAFTSCGSNKTPSNAEAEAGDSSTKLTLGVALWTFHNVDFPESLKMADSAGLKLVEANTFHKTGKELNDTLLGQLSPAGIEKIKSYAQQ